MSLERFRRTRMVILSRRSMAYRAARVMADNHIGAVLVSQPPGIAGILTVFKVVAASVSSGQIREVRERLPEEMKSLFPAAA